MQQSVEIADPNQSAGVWYMTFSLRSSAFSKGEPIPAKYTADGENLSPPLEWSDPPAGTKSFALIVEDPDAPPGVRTSMIAPLVFPINARASGEKIEILVPENVNLGPHLG